ncbi:hypothetical protein, partial [Streptomyces europaeiscabiei]|uniref:hypothetical protein n=1 Tax=Streptomyces europaeiscabiei TaxID=146819 RepID=UPI0029A107A6
MARTADGVQGGGRENDAARRRRRAQFLRELTEARELRDRVQPRRAKAARLRHAMRMRTLTLLQPHQPRDTLVARLYSNKQTGKTNAEKSM